MYLTLQIQGNSNPFQVWKDDPEILKTFLLVLDLSAGKCSHPYRSQKQQLPANDQSANQSGSIGTAAAAHPFLPNTV